MPDPDEIVAFLSHYVAACDDAGGVAPLPVRELAQLLDAVAGAGFEPSSRLDS